MSHDHSQHGHGGNADTQVRPLAIALTLIVAFMAVEVTVALIADSLALLSDAAHMLVDAGALGLSVWAARLAQRPAGGRMTFGFRRAEILSAQANGITLLILGLVIFVEGLRRLAAPPDVRGGLVLATALVGAAVNVLALWQVARANRENLNVEGQLQASAHRPLCVRGHRRRRPHHPHDGVRTRRPDRVALRRRLDADRRVATSARERPRAPRGRAGGDLAGGDRSARYAITRA